MKGRKNVCANTWIRVRAQEPLPRMMMIKITKKKRGINNNFIKSLQMKDFFLKIAIFIYFFRGFVIRNL